MKLAHRERRKIFLAGAVVAAVAFLGLAAVLFSRPPAQDAAAIPLPAPQELPPQHEGRAAEYMRDCVTGVLRNGAVPDSCRTAEAIRQAYDLDVWALLQSEFAATSDTAQKIVRGDLLRQEDYRACLQRGACRLLPLPRKEDSQAQYDATVSYLQRLAAGAEMDSYTCSIIDMCRALMKAGLYAPPAQGRQ